MTMATPDWTAHLQQGERLMWTGRPELVGFWPHAALGMFGLTFAPHGLVLLLLPLGLAVIFARDAYALTERRILALRHPFTQISRVDSLPRAGVYAGPQMGKGPRSVVFTAPDRTTISFRFLSRKTQRHLIAEYPKGGPFPVEGKPQ